MGSIFMMERIYDIAHLVRMRKIVKIAHGFDMTEQIMYMSQRILPVLEVSSLVFLGLLQMWCVV